MFIRINTLSTMHNDLVWFSLFWFYSISTILGYLMPNLFSYIKAVFFSTN